ncbi:aromatic ring-hydroxylating dioxygenase subunit alpha [Paenibacillus puerhi]|uniref:aromatic ring-hydroxylating dioxygenase subunit alpha n=1 Tax=Paenibacillus puerhi TaxID=2692622 RepID=UPI00135C98E5|nr:aromatic ring-hydroxylating dioxygenase subunit alpha [Paenibacillus puerhi]
MINESYRPSRKEDHEVFPCTWYAVGWSKEVKREPIKKRLLGRDLVLFRDQNGALQALHAYCPHRGADLSLGRCEGGLLQCAYHAWSFDGQGRCVEIPAHPGRPIPAFADTRSYPVLERIGLIWVYPMARQLLEGEPPPLDLFPVLENRDFTLAPYDAVWQAHLTRVVESVLDVAHVPIVHNKTIGKNSSKDITIDFQAKENTIRIRNGKAYLEYAFPQHWLLKPVKTEGSQFINYVTFTPIEKEVTAIYGLAGRNFARSVPGMSRMFSAYSSKVLKEDQAIVESQHPRPIPDALRMEAHVQADGPQVRFRQRWYQFLTNEEPRIKISDAEA